MKIWLIKDNETLPLKEKTPRLFRMGILADFLARQGHQVTWWTSDFNHFTKSHVDLSLVKDNEELGYELKVLPAPGYAKNISLARIKHNRKFAKTLKSALKKARTPDIIIAALPTIEPAALAVNYGKKFNIPVLVDLRDMWPDIMVMHFPKIFQGLIKLGLMPKFAMTKKLLSEATGLTGITEPFLQWGLNYAGRAKNKNDAVIHFSYKPENINDENEAFSQKLMDITKGKRVISFVGSLNENHLPLMIDVIKTFDKAVVLLIAGSGRCDEILKKRAQGAKNIFFLGWINKGQIKEVLKVSHFGLIPYLSRKDFLASIPSKVAEYLSEGLILISLLKGCLADFIEKEGIGYAFSPRANEIKKALTHILALDEKAIGELSQKAKKAFDNNFAEDIVLKKFEAHLESVIHQHALARENHGLPNPI